MSAAAGLWASVDGQISPAAAAVLPALDRGFLFGEAVYEVFSAREGRPLFWAEHLARLQASAAHIGLPAADGALLRAEVGALCAAVGAPEVYVRLMLTGGCGGDLSLDRRGGLALGRVAFARPLVPMDPSMLSNGCALAVQRVARRDGEAVAKVAARPAAIAQRAAAHEAGADEALLVDALGRVLEGATSSFFGVQGGGLVTPPLGLGVLDGITRRHVLAAARGLGLAAAEGILTEGALAGLEEAFICSSTRGVVPVRRIDGRVLGPPGPVTRGVQAAYAAAVAAHLG